MEKMKDDIILNLMTRIDFIKDKVDTLSNNYERRYHYEEKLDDRINNLETASIAMSDTLLGISSDLQQIKEGPVYSLDRYIKRKVASYTMGIGGFGIILWLTTYSMFS